MCLLVPNFWARGGDANVDVVPEDVLDRSMAETITAEGCLGALRIEPVRQLRRACSSGSPSKQLSYQRCVGRVRQQRTGAASARLGACVAVAERSDCGGMDATGDSARLGDAPLLADLLESVLGDREHDPEHHAPGRGARIEVVVNGHEDPIHVADSAYLDQSIDQIAPEPIRLPNDKSVALAALNSRD